MGLSNGPTPNLAQNQAVADEQQVTMQQQMQSEAAQQQSQYDAQNKLLQQSLFPTTSSTTAASSTPANLPSLGALIGVASPGGGYLSNGTTRASFLGD